MKRLLHLILAVLAVTGMASAKVITVDNKPGSVAMFTSAQAAVDAAVPGDTILLAGSPASYGLIRLSKSLDLAGPGWGLEENKIPGLNKNAASCTISVGRDVNGSSSGSTFTGLAVESWSYWDSSAAVDGHTLDRCRVDGGFNAFWGKVTITRCVFAAGFDLTRSGSKISNSIILSSCKLGLGVTADHCVFSNPNVVFGNELSSVSNSLFFGRPTQETFRSNFRGSVTYCMATAELDGPTFLPEGGGNINGVPVELACVWTGSTDGKWQLRTNSTAKGKGFNGVDIGAFGGALPYVLSGVPSTPRVTRFVVPSTVTSTSGLRFEVDAQAF
jgi:hypothetical protein